MIAASAHSPSQPTWFPCLHPAGRNVDGALGDGTKVDRSTPTLVGDATHVFIAIAVGGSHTCGVRADGRALCWGESSTPDACTHDGA